MGNHNGYEIKERFEYTCVYCRKLYDENCNGKLTVDHVIPKVRWEEYGLTREELNEDWNLVAACSNCNSKRKKDKKPEEFLEKVPIFKDNFRDNPHVSEKIKGLLGLLEVD